jgi:putative peptidoglycan lipid II flippase
LAGSVLAGGSVVLIAATLLLAGAAPFLIPLVGTGFSAPKLALAESLFYVVVGIMIATGVSAIFAAVLNAHERFAFTAVAPLAIPVCTIGVFWPLEEQLGIYALAAGTLLGYAVECLALAGGMARLGLLDWPRWRGLDDDLRHVRSQYLPIALGSLLMNSSILIDQGMAASLASGNVSILNYGNKIVAFVLSIVAISLSTVLFPRFSRMINAGQWNQLARTFNGYAQAILIASIPCIAILAWLSEPLIRLLFERGAFTPETTQAVAGVQLCYLLQIPFAVLVMLGYRMLSALDGNRTVLAIGALNLVMNVGGNLLLMHWLGINGIALSTSLMYLVAMGVTMWAIRLRLAERMTAEG